MLICIFLLAHHCSIEIHLLGFSENQLDQIILTVTVEGDVTSEETVSESEDSLLPGPSFLSVIGILALIVFRRKN